MSTVIKKLIPTPKLEDTKRAVDETIPTGESPVAVTDSKRVVDETIPTGESPVAVTDSKRVVDETISTPTPTEDPSPPPTGASPVPVTETRNETVLKIINRYIPPTKTEEVEEGGVEVLNTDQGTDQGTDQQTLKVIKRHIIPPEEWADPPPKARKQIAREAEKFYQQYTARWDSTKKNGRVTNNTYAEMQKAFGENFHKQLPNYVYVDKKTGKLTNLSGFKVWSSTHQFPKDRNTVAADEFFNNPKNAMTKANFKNREFVMRYFLTATEIDVWSALVIGTRLHNNDAYLSMVNKFGEGNVYRHGTRFIIRTEDNKMHVSNEIGPSMNDTTQYVAPILAQVIGAFFEFGKPGFFGRAAQSGVGAAAFESFLRNSVNLLSDDAVDPSTRKDNLMYFGGIVAFDMAATVVLSRIGKSFKWIFKPSQTKEQKQIVKEFIQMGKNAGLNIRYSHIVTQGWLNDILSGLPLLPGASNQAMLLAKELNSASQRAYYYTINRTLLKNRNNTEMVELITQGSSSLGETIQQLSESILKGENLRINEGYKELYKHIGPRFKIKLIRVEALYKEQIELAKANPNISYNEEALGELSKIMENNVVTFKQIVDARYNVYRDHLINPSEFTEQFINGIDTLIFQSVQRYDKNFMHNIRSLVDAGSIQQAKDFVNIKQLQLNVDKNVNVKTGEPTAQSEIFNIKLGLAQREYDKLYNRVPALDETGKPIRILTNEEYVQNLLFDRQGIFKAFDDINPNSNIDLSQTKNIIGILSQRVAKGDEEAKIFYNHLQEIIGKTNMEILTGIRKPGEESRDVVSLMRTNIGSSLKGISVTGVPFDKKNMTAIYAALSQDIGDSLSLYKPELHLKWLALNKDKEKLENLYKPFFNNIINKDSSEKVWSTIQRYAYSADGGDLQALRKIRNYFDEYNWSIIVANIMDKMARSSPGKSSLIESNFSSIVFLTNYQKMSPEVKKTLFGDPKFSVNYKVPADVEWLRKLENDPAYLNNKKQRVITSKHNNLLDSLDEIAKLFSLIKGTDRTPYQTTARSVISLAFFTALAKIGFDAMRGKTDDVVRDLGGAAVIGYGIPAWTYRLLTSKAFTKWIVDTSTSTDSYSLQLARLVVIANTASAEDKEDIFKFIAYFGSYMKVNTTSEEDLENPTVKHR